MNTFPRRPAAPFPFLALLCAACAQVAEQPLPDGGLPQPPHVAEVQPAPGAIAASARFHVAFSAPMDESLLLVDADHSETVVLVRAGDAEIVAAALAHGKLTARLRALLLAAHAAVGASAESIDLAPDQPLPAGEIFLLERLPDGLAAAARLMRIADVPADQLDPGRIEADRGSDDFIIADIVAVDLPARAATQNMGRRKQAAQFVIALAAREHLARAEIKYQRSVFHFRLDRTPP